MSAKQKVPHKIAKLTGFERALMKLSPRMASNRYLARINLESNSRAYEAVEKSRLRKEQQDSRSADQIGSISADNLRFKARYLDENHDVAKSVLNTLVANVVGGGILTFPTVRNVEGGIDRGFNAELMRLFRQWSRRPDVTWSHTWARCQQLAARSWFRDGEAFTQMFMGSVDGLVHGSAVPFSIELMEADFCPTNVFSDGRSPTIASQVEPGNTVRQGIERDSFKRPQAYFFWRDYPSELQTQFSPFIINPINVSFAIDSENLLRVDASRVAHLKVADRIGQTRGISIFASVYTRLDDLKDYEESERIAARIGAAFALAITKPIDSVGNSSGADWREMDLAPGIIADNLAPGEKIETIKNERPTNGFADWRQDQLRSVAGGSRAGYSSLSKTYEGSYSSQRQELMEQFVIYRMIREEFVGEFVDPVWRTFVTMAITSGALDAFLSGVDQSTLFDAEHVGRGAPYIEPRKEVEADEKKVLAGFNARHQIILERGGNPLETQALIEAEREMDEEAGLVFSSTAQPEPTAAPPGDSSGGSDNEPVNDPDADDDSDDDSEGDSEDDDARLEGVDIGERGEPFIVGARYEANDGNVYVYTKDGMIPEGRQVAAI